MIPKYKENLKYLWFFPAYLLLFFILERVDLGQQYHLISMNVDYVIPFNEWFVIPYLSWHALIAVTVYYTMIHETDNFRKLMKFFIITTVICFIMFIAYPTELNLRPVEYPRDNLLTDVAKLVYTFDTPTNVTPSMHIIGSLGLLFTAWNTRGKDSLLKKTIMLVSVFFICLSTLVLKQHSLLDVIIAVPISLVCGVVCFTDWKREDLKLYRKSVLKERASENLGAIAISIGIVLIMFLAFGFINPDFFIFSPSLGM